LKVVQGTIPVCIEKARSTFAVAVKEAQGKEFTLDGDDIRITQFKRENGGRYALHFSVLISHADDNINPPTERFDLQDAQGRSYERCGMGGSGLRPVEYDDSFAPPDQARGVVGPPSKLVCIRGTPLVNEVPFEFKNVPLELKGSANRP